MVKSTVDNAESSGSGSVMAVGQHAGNSASTDTVTASASSLAAAAAAALAALGTEDAEMDEGRFCWLY